MPAFDPTGARLTTAARPPGGPRNVMQSSFTPRSGCPMTMPFDALRQNAAAAGSILHPAAPVVAITLTFANGQAVTIAGMGVPAAAEIAAAPPPAPAAPPPL